MSKHHGQVGLYPAELCNYNHQQQPGDRFGRLFPELPGLYTDPSVLAAVGAAGGPMQASGTVAELRTANVPVGHVFFGQFIDHDITLDVTSSLRAVNRPSATTNVRTPTLDLDCVYGSGPEAHPFLYENSGSFKSAKLVVDDANDDLQRNAQGVAMIGDFRNDENRIVSQLQLGVIRLHNLFCDELAAAGYSGKELYEHAREQTSWHYQWCVVHDFLSTMCGRDAVLDVLANGRQYYRPSQPFMPIEFSVAAYRFGHSMAPEAIQIQAGEPAHPLFAGFLGSFSPIGDPGEVVHWPELFAVPGSSATWQRADKLDQKLAPLLLDLHVIDPSDERSLATRNLQRGQGFMLPSGEQVAALMGRGQHEIDEVSEAAADMHAGLAGATPLWLYILLEGAEIGRGGDASAKGEGLGPVGGRIVAEVIIGLLECDERSWLSTNRAWSPANDRGTIAELLHLSSPS